MSESRSKDNILVKLFEKLQSADLSTAVFGKSKVEENVECSNCKTKFDWVKLPECKMGLVECPGCKWQVDQIGKAYEGKVPVNPSGKVPVKAKQDPYAPHISGNCQYCGKEGTTLTNDAGEEFCTQECLDAAEAEFKARPPESRKLNVTKEGVVPANPSEVVDDKLIKALVEDIPAPEEKKYTTTGEEIVVCPKCKGAGELGRRGSCHFCHGLGEVPVSALKETIPGGPIQGDVPAGIPTSAASKIPLVPGNKTYAPANIAQNLPEDESSYTVVAQGISVKDVADKIASVDSKRRIIPDKEDPKKFAVIEPIK